MTVNNSKRNLADSLNWRSLPQEHRVILKSITLSSMLGFLMSASSYLYKKEPLQVKEITTTSGIGMLNGALFGLVIGCVLLWRAKRSALATEGYQRLQLAIQRKKQTLINKNHNKCVGNLGLFNANLINKLNLTDEFRCPITKEIFVDPIVAPDGNSYEREALQCWYDDGNSSCPLNPNLTLTNPSELSTNLALVRQIELIAKQMTENESQTLTLSK